jgi:hypothetical protein
MQDFQKVLARVQTDYAFYVQCQADPAAALAGYSLSAEERAALSDPTRLADWMAAGRPRLPPITIKISGTHDWVNRAAADKDAGSEQVDRQVETVRRAATDADRHTAVLRLMEQLG